MRAFLLTLTFVFAGAALAEQPVKRIKPLPVPAPAQPKDSVRTLPVAPMPPFTVELTVDGEQARHAARDSRLLDLHAKAEARGRTDLVERIAKLKQKEKRRHLKALARIAGNKARLPAPAKGKR